MSKAATQLWQRLLAAALPRLADSIERMPREKALARGVALGNVGYRLAGRSRERARRNLRLAYPEKTDAERELLIRRCFQHWGKVSMDFLKSPSYDSQTVLSLVTRIEGMDEYVYPTLASGRGIVSFSGHLGIFEMFGRYAGANRIPLTGVVRYPKNPAFSQFVKRLREGSGYQTIDSNGGLALRELLKALKRNEVIGILPDQNANDLFVPFFGVPAGTADGAALLAYKTGSVLLPAFCVLNPDDTYRVVVRPPIPIDPNGDRQTELLKATTAISASIEEAVREWPEQYLWLHNRFKGSFEPQYKDRWPEGYDYEDLKRRWEG